MIQTLIHTTENNNLYLYDDQSRLSMIIHPELKKSLENSTDCDPYYLKKNNYLKSHGFFTMSKAIDFGIVTETMIREGIINTLQIIFEVTDSCNLNCAYCGFGEMYEGYDIRNSKNLNIRDAKILLKYIYDLKINNNNKNRLKISFYGGEPLLNINLIKQIIKFVNQLNVGKEINIEYAMTTNATLIHRHIGFLVANEFKLMFSLDGNEVNHSYRIFGKSKKNSFRKVIENIDMIQRDYPDFFANNISFNSVLHNRNSAKDVYEFIYTRYQKVPTISDLVIRDLLQEKKEIFNEMYHSTSISQAEYRKEYSIQIPILARESMMYLELDIFFTHFSINYYISHINMLLKNENKYLPTCTCLPLSHKLFLTTGNKLLSCESINFKYAVGKVDKNVMIDIPEVTRQYNSYYNHLSRVCKCCYAYRYCGACMFHIHNLDKLDTEEFVCDQFKDQNGFAEKLYHIFSFLEEYPTVIFELYENI